MTLGKARRVNDTVLGSHHAMGMAAIYWADRPRTGHPGGMAGGTAGADSSCMVTIVPVSRPGSAILETGMGITVLVPGRVALRDPGALGPGALGPGALAPGALNGAEPAGEPAAGESAGGSPARSLWVTIDETWYYS